MLYNKFMGMNWDYAMQAYRVALYWGAESRADTIGRGIDFSRAWFADRAHNSHENSGVSRVRGPAFVC